MVARPAFGHALYGGNQDGRRVPSRTGGVVASGDATDELHHRRLERLAERLREDLVHLGHNRPAIEGMATVELVELLGRSHEWLMGPPERAGLADN
jgi:hypothetical protein